MELQIQGLTMDSIIKNSLFCDKLTKKFSNFLLVATKKNDYESTICRLLFLNLSISKVIFSALLSKQQIVLRHRDKIFVERNPSLKRSGSLLSFF